MNSLEVILNIAQTTPSIGKFTFHKFPKQQLVQESGLILGENEQRMLDKALELKKTGLPFWDGLMLSTFNNPYYSESLLEKALRHNSHPQLVYVSKENLLTWIEEQGQAIDSYALCSKVVMTNGLEKHLPLLDFHIMVSGTNIKVVESVCRLMGLVKGWILNSGESYHFVGDTPIDSDDLEQLLYRALMFTPIIDKAWISHQLREKTCSLRIGRKSGFVPKVVLKL